MTALLRMADAFRGALVVFLIGASILLVAMVAMLAVQRGVRNAIARRRAGLERRYQDDIRRAVDGSDVGSAPRLARAPRRHRRIMGASLLAVLKSLVGPAVGRARETATAIDLLASWRADLRQRHWWRRADAARALGLLQDASAFDRLVELLDDAHDEVRAAAVGALGRLGDARAVPELLRRLGAQSRHQRVRIVESLRAFGAEAADPILVFARAHLDALPDVADILGAACGGMATADLLTWSRDERPAVRAAAMRALGTTGLDDRSFYFALQALGDPDAHVRSMAARALGRCGREDAAVYLAPCLGDEWLVAAQAARALGRLAAAGRAELARQAEGVGQASDLARQMLWTAGAHAAH